MDSLIIEATEDSPKITFDTVSNRFMISGESRPENAGKFYTPVINWIVKYEEVLYSRKQDTNDDSVLVFIFKLDYFNSTSAKYIMDVLLIIKKFVDQGYNINIEWHYDKRDDDMLDAGNEFSDTVDLKFDFIEY
ncbi:MAG: DUF1987 domain-containing protein [Bacteroidota bacterium]|nr:DUF1987 domain-containing protein [Bacteroidia bacterium]MDP1745616.1 DUF1987 domain-containing protein [Bacteroidota bacterium]